MYAIQTTPGFVISSRPNGEAGKVLSIFTRDLGLIKASAQGIRFEKSKLRPFIQDYSTGVFSFVRGKEFWRLTSAQEGIEHKVKNSHELFARIALLLGRLLQGEEAHPALFDMIDMCFMFINDHHDIDKESMMTLESLLVIRILQRLGYIAHTEELKSYIESDTISVEMLNALKEQRSVMNTHINKALRESHL